MCVCVCLGVYMKNREKYIVCVIDRDRERECVSYICVSDRSKEGMYFLWGVCAFARLTVISALDGDLMCACVFVEKRAARK